MSNSIFKIRDGAFKALKSAKETAKSLGENPAVQLTEDQNRQVTQAIYHLNKAQESLKQYGSNWFTRVIRRIFCGSLIQKVDAQIKKILPRLNQVQSFEERADRINLKLMEALNNCPVDKKEEFKAKLVEFRDKVLKTVNQPAKEMILLQGALASKELTQEEFENKASDLISRSKLREQSSQLQNELNALLKKFTQGYQIDLAQL